MLLGALSAINKFFFGAPELKRNSGFRTIWPESPEFRRSGRFPRRNVEPSSPSRHTPFNFFSHNAITKTNSAAGLSRLRAYKFLDVKSPPIGALKLPLRGHIRVPGMPMGIFIPGATGCRVVAESLREHPSWAAGLQSN